MILVTGGAGVMGRRLCEALREKGEAVRILCLPGDPTAADMERLGVEIRFGDIRDTDTLGPALEGVMVVFHLAAIILSPGRPELFRDVNWSGTKNVLAEAERHGVDHFIYVSSASVTYGRSNAYSRSKLDCEELIRQARIPHYTLVRPTLVYDQEGSLEFAHFTQYLKRFPVVPFIGTGGARKSPVYAEDLIPGFIGILGNPLSYGKTYNFSGGETLTIKEMAVLMLRHMGKPKVIFPVPVWICRILAAILERGARLLGKPPLLTWQTISGIIQDADLDCGEARRDLGYNPRPFRTGLPGLKKLENCLRA